MKTFWRYLPLLLLALAWEAVSRLELVSSSAGQPRFRAFLLAALSVLAV